MSDKSPHQGYCFTTSYDGLSRVLRNEIELESAINPHERLQFMALWDTGASCSLIRPEVAQKLNLIPVSIGAMSTPTSENEPSPIYLINLYLSSGIKVLGVPVLEGIPGGCDMLIGMDIIGMGDFAVTNFDGKTVFSFRIPSLTIIDFVRQSYLIPIVNNNKIGRNDPCPCGSGKKYKYCCGSNN